MKYHILHDFITSTSFEEKSSDHFKDLHKIGTLDKFRYQSDVISGSSYESKV